MALRDRGNIAAGDRVVAVRRIAGWWSVAAGSIVAVIIVLLLGHGQTRFFLRTARGIIRTRSIDRRNRLEIGGPPEEQRILNAVNRLADNVELTLSESESEPPLSGDDSERDHGRNFSCG